MKDMYMQKGAGHESYTSKKWICCGKVTFLQGRAGVYPANYLTSADEMIPDYWSEIPFL